MYFENCVERLKIIIVENKIYADTKESFLPFEKNGKQLKHCVFITIFFT